MNWNLSFRMAKKVIDRGDVRVRLGKTAGKLIVLSMVLGDLAGKSPKKILDTAVNMPRISEDKRGELSEMREDINSQLSPRSYVFTKTGIRYLPYNDGADVVPFVTTREEGLSVDIFYSCGCPENLC